MKVYLLVLRDPPHDELGVIHATDVAHERESDMARHIRRWGFPPEDLRWLTVTLPDDALERAFAEVEVEGEVG